MAQKYDPNQLYYALKRVRRTANCVQGQPKNAPGTVYVEPAILNDKGQPEGVFFTMADRTPEQTEMLVNGKVIAPLPASEAPAKK